MNGCAGVGIPKGQIEEKQPLTKMLLYSRMIETTI
jgi:hypothetical protein